MSLKLPKLPKVYLVLYWFLGVVYMLVGLIFLEVKYEQKQNTTTILKMNSVYSATAGTTKSGLVSVSEESLTPIYFVGDVMLARHVEALMQEHGSDYPFRQLNFLASSSYVFGNFEASIPKVHTKTPNYTFSFAVNPIFLVSLKQAGFTHLSLANNHALDNGVDALVNTKLELEATGLTAWGNPQAEVATSSFTYLTFNEKIVAVLALNTIGMTFVEADLLTLLAEASAQSDFQIAYVHWGTEYDTKRSVWQRDFAELLATAGVDIIIGHHPHVVQGIETIGNTVVFYSLGNFIFDQYFSPEVQTGLVLKLDYTSPGLAINLIPVTSQGMRAQPRAMSETEQAIFLKNLAEDSEKRLTSMITSGVLYLDTTLATSAEMIIMEL